LSLLFFVHACELPKLNIRNKTEEIKLFNTHCGSCHQLPNPKNLTKEIWQNAVLPRMGLRLGIPNSKVDFRKNLSQEEQDIISISNVFPEEPLITEEEWRKLQNYIIDLAPTAVNIDSSRLSRNNDNDQFTPIDLPIDNLYGSTITAIEFDALSKELWIANHENKIFHWTKEGSKQINIKNTVVDFHFTTEGTLITDIGELFPSDKKQGNISLLKNKKKVELLPLVRRPVHSEYWDMNKDGSIEIIVAEYGNTIGGLFIYIKKDDAYVAKPLLELPGAIKFYVSDINNDGLNDITALFAQGDESIWQFTQKEDLKFDAKRILRFPPEYGTSDFIFVDFDKDGQEDIITAHGDNADYSYIKKPFHGVRIHLKNEDNYVEKYFYPIYGSTKVIAEDFDYDGDIDIATSAFFPDFDILLNESFVYLENMNTQKFKFNTQTVKSSIPIRSLCLEKADFDGDGDIDIIMGNFGISPQPIPDKLKKIWDNSKHDLIVLSNNFK